MNKNNNGRTEQGSVQDQINRIKQNPAPARSSNGASGRNGTSSRSELEREREELLLFEEELMNRPVRNNDKVESPRLPDEPKEMIPEEGSILLMDQDQVAIFDCDRSSKGFQRILILEPRGGVSIRRIGLHVTDHFKLIGKLSSEPFEDLRDELQWDRDTIVFHLDDFHHANLIPHVSSGKPILQEKVSENGSRQTAPVMPLASRPQRTVSRSVVETSDNLKRGQKFEIAFSPERTWQAVYWGESEQGSIIAHHDQNQWALMHLDITQYKDSLKAMDMISDEDQKEILKTAHNL